MNNIILNFTLKPVIKKKKPKTATTKPANSSRLCAGVVVKVNDELKIKIYTKFDPDFEESLIIPFTEESYILKGKRRIFYKEKDKYGHNIVYIRDKADAIGRHVPENKFTTFTEREVCTGYIVKKNGNLYFDLKDTHGKGRFVEELPVELTDPKPLFKK